MRSWKQMTAAIGASYLAVFAQPSFAADLRIENVTIVSPERDNPLRDVDVTIDDGRIAEITSGSTSHQKVNPKIATIDGRGLYLTPGLIDSHVHLDGIAGMTPAQEAEHPDIAKAARDQIPRSYLLYGFTTLIDLVSTPDAMARWKAHDLVPDTYFCGGAALMDGYPMNNGVDDVPKALRYHLMPYMIIEPGTKAPPGIDPALHTPAAVVRRMKADGAICVKTFYETGFGSNRHLPVPKLETIRELVSAAHAAGLPVLIHANSADAQDFGIAAGVDILAHGLWNWDDGPLTAELTPPFKTTVRVKNILDRVVARHVGWQPTIQVLSGIRDLFQPDFLSNPLLAGVLPQGLIDWYRTPEGQWFHNVMAQPDQGLAQPGLGSDPNVSEKMIYSRAGGAIGGVKHVTGYLASHDARILFGTDTPSAPTYANPPGLNGWFEMQNLVAAGLTPSQIFKAATLSNAQALHLDREVGTVEVGKRANLLLLRQDPTQTIDAYANIVNVFLKGRMLDTVDLTANGAQKTIILRKLR